MARNSLFADLIPHIERMEELQRIEYLRQRPIREAMDAWTRKRREQLPVDSWSGDVWGRWDPMEDPRSECGCGW